MGWPGLGTEVRAICQEIGIEDVTQEECRIDKEEVKEAIRLNHLQNMKEAMQGEKLRAMAMTDMRDRRPYTKYHVEECRMAFRLETYQFDCRANMPTRYGRDLRCRACCPQTEGQPDLEDAEQEGCIESQEHLEGCKAYADLWQGLGPYSLQSRCRYFMKLKLRRLQQQQQQKEP